MFREHIKANEVKVSHDLSVRINLKRPERLNRFDNDGSDSKIEMRYAG